jgi:uncharacterized protein (TIGR03067 family)
MRFSIRDLLWLTIVVAFTAPSRSIAQEANKLDLETLQGEWVFHSSLQNTKNITHVHQIPILIKGNLYSFERQGEREWIEFKIDATKEPKHWDHCSNDSRPSLGIYKLEGDTLTICLWEEWHAGARPRDFSDKVYDSRTIVLKRKKQ